MDTDFNLKEWWMNHYCNLKLSWLFSQLREKLRGKAEENKYYMEKYSNLTDQNIFQLEKKHSEKKDDTSWPQLDCVGTTGLHSSSLLPVPHDFISHQFGLSMVTKHEIWSDTLYLLCEIIQIQTEHNNMPAVTNG